MIINDLSPFWGSANIVPICAKTQAKAIIRAKCVQDQGIRANVVST